MPRRRTRCNPPLGQPLQSEHVRETSDGQQDEQADHPDIEWHETRLRPAVSTPHKQCACDPPDVYGLLTPSGIGRGEPCRAVTCRGAGAFGARAGLCPWLRVGVRQPGEIAATVSDAICDIQRLGVHPRGLIRTARSGRVADEIVYAAHKHHADEILIGGSRRSWLGGLLSGSVVRRVLRVSDLPVVIVRSPARSDSRDPAPSGSPRGARGHARA